METYVVEMTMTTSEDQELCCLKGVDQIVAKTKIVINLYEFVPRESADRYVLRFC